MGKGICDLIAKIGNESVSYQILSNSITKAKLSRGDTEISFVTNQVTPNDVVIGSGKVGIVIWVSQDDYTSARNEILSK